MVGAVSAAAWPPPPPVRPYRFDFYLGVGHPNHLADSRVPLFISATTLAARYKTEYQGQGHDWPVQTFGTRWAGDSGAYAALMLGNGRRDHPWRRWPDDYGSMWVDFVEAVGHDSRELGPDFVGVQDWPCEPQVLAATGMTVRDHQELTTENFCYLAEEFPFIPWLPTLQGWTPDDYVRHVEAYRAAGVDLAGERVGVGSVCRRGAQRDVARVVGTIAGLGLGMRLHGFGVSINALRLCGHLLASADSQAWSATARRERLLLPGCEHPTRSGGRGDCRNCFRYAQVWRGEALAAQESAGEAAVASAGAGQLALFEVAG